MWRLLRQSLGGGGRQRCLQFLVDTSSPRAHHSEKPIALFTCGTLRALAMPESRDGLWVALGYT